MARPLTGKIAVVAGATRAAGRGIARMLGEAGATVYCSGRSARGRPATPGRPETIEETAALVSAAGFEMLDRAVRTHIVTSRCAAPFMVERKSGLIVEVTDGDHAGYRGSLFYDLAKTSTIRLAFAMALELKPHGVTALAVTPGFLRCEAMLERLGVTDANWRDAASKARGFEASESPCYVGRAIAALATDPNVARKAGGVYASWTLAREYGFTDLDGRAPHWGDYVRDSLTAILDRGGTLDSGDRFWLEAWYSQLKDEAQWTALMDRVAAALRHR